VIGEERKTLHCHKKVIRVNKEKKKTSIRFLNHKSGFVILVGEELCDSISKTLQG